MIHLKPLQYVAGRPQFFCPQYVEENAVVFDSMCGHGAFSAATGIPIEYAMEHFGRGGWVGIPLMEAALKSCGLTPIRNDGAGTGAGPCVSLIQFTGRWMNPGVPLKVRCLHRHWVAREAGLIWDVNLEQWVTPDVWEAIVLGDYKLMPKGGTGWEYFRTISFAKPASC